MKLKRKIAFSFVLLALIPTVIGMMVIFTFTRQSLAKTADQLTSEYIGRVGEGLSAMFEGVGNVVLSTSHMPSIKNFEWNTAGPVLNQISNDVDYIKRFLLIEQDGSYWMSSNLTGNPYFNNKMTSDNNSATANLTLLRDRVYFQTLVTQNRSGAIRLSVTDVMLSTATGERQCIVGATVTDDRNSVTGMVGAVVTNSEFGTIFSTLVSDFENMLAKATMQSKASAQEIQAPKAPSSENMTDDEFEALLDSLHGKGMAPGQEHKNDAPDQVPEAPKPQVAQPQATQSQASVTPAPAPKVEPTAPPKVTPKPQAQPVKPSTADTTVRVETKILDVIMNMVGELVLVRNRLLSIGNNQADEELKKVIANLDVVTADIQGAVMKTRMQQIKKVFGRFPRVVRDLARNLNKKIDLVMEGEETDLDKNLVDALADPMVHLVRNSCDHGIEMPDVRKKMGKPEVGTITLSASQQGDHILLRIIDDGAGMDPEKLKQVGIKKGVIDEETASRMSDEEAFNLIFAPGFSTKAQISDISGRGVGMDVVKTNITKLNGSIHIISEKGVGSTIEIKVPLTLAILPTLMVKVGGHSFALPLTCVREIFYLELDSVRNVDGQTTIVIRDKAIPLFFLQDWLIRNLPEGYQHPKKGHIVLVNYGNNQQVAFVVDELVGQEEVVIKPLDNLLHGTPGMAGATVTSDGGIALIIDVPGLLMAYAKKYTANMSMKKK